MTDLFFLFLPLIFFSVLVGFLGKERECGFIRAFLLSLVVTPIIGAIMVLLCKRNKSQAELLAEAKIYFDTGTATETEYKDMIADITQRRKLYSLKHYKKGIINPLKH